jgi:single-strand DNA-binding protein
MSNFKDLVRIGKDAVLRHTQAGKPVLGFSAAFDTGFGDRKQTNWLDCSLWGERGEKLAEYLTKGTLILVEGDLGTREHDGKTYLTLDVREVKLTGKGDKPAGDCQERSPRGGGPARQPPSTGPTGGGDPFPDDDIPFVTNRSVW